MRTPPGEMPPGARMFLTYRYVRYPDIRPESAGERVRLFTAGWREYCAGEPSGGLIPGA